MKGFFKLVFGSCFGTLIALAFLSLIGIAVVSIASLPDNKIEKKSILLLDFNGQIPELSNNVAKSDYELVSPKAMGVWDIGRTIEYAKTDDNISGILIKGNYSGLDLSKIQNIRTFLKDFKESEKFIYAYGDEYSQSSYMIASLADSIFLNPNGMIGIKGYVSTRPYFKEIMDELGLKMEIFYAGKFKSATESYRLTEMSDENRLQLGQYLNMLDETMLNIISEDRDIPLSEVANIKNELLGRRASYCLENNLVDSVYYSDQFESFMKRNLEIDEDDKPNYISLKDYQSKIELPKQKGKERIAVIFAEGEIRYGESNKGMIMHKQYAKLIKKLRKDDKVKAIVFRVDSPGGDAFASDLIWRELDLTSKSGKPVIVSMGKYAASGGYYISTMADRIFADETCLTGSIGVFSMFPNVKEFFSEKLKIHFDSVGTAKYALGNNMHFEMSPGYKEIVQDETDFIYEKFLGLVAEGRSSTTQEINEIAQGRIWTAQQALDNGLIDEIGGLKEAINFAAEKIELEEYKLVEYPILKEEPWEAILSNLDMAQIEHQERINSKIKALKPILDMSDVWLESENPQARMPFEINF